MASWIRDKDDGTDRVLAQTATLLAERGDHEALALLVDVRSIEFVDSAEQASSCHDDSWGWVNAYYKIATVDVDDHLVARFTDEAVDRILPTLKYVAGRNGIEFVKYFEARPALPEVDSEWRQTFAARLTADRPSNQARRERDIARYPTEDGLTFGSNEELRVYRALRRLQDLLPEDDTIAIFPLPGARLRAGHTWSPDFLVTGRGRAVIIEVDGPHHRTLLRRADDANRDLQFQRCGIPVVRLPVEDLKVDSALDARLCEEFRRYLPPSRRAA